MLVTSTFYVALIQAGAVKLHAGIPVDGYIEGDNRNVFHYPTEPLTQVVQRAARER